MDNKKIKVDALDFNEIKSNLINFMSGQEEFKDYNFEGSGLSVLMNLLAYNTHYNALYSNFVINEMFLDSASKRNSVVSIAKLLGYTPKSITSAKAIINLEVKNITNDNQLINLPSYSSFTSIKEGVKYNFVNTNDITKTKINNRVVFENVELIEGSVFTEKYVATPTTSFKISNFNCDTSTIKVFVYDSVGNNNSKKYTLCSDITTVNDQSLIYFIKEIDNGQYELQFGNDIIGKALVNGNLVVITYIISTGINGNDCTNFNFNSTISGNETVKTIQKSIGGLNKETIDSIKFNAPRSYSMQNRAVTKDDYKSLVLKEYPNIRSINVWGGEENNPPIYGKVFISIKPEVGDYLDQETKKYITNSILKPKSVITTIPVIIDPEYINIELLTTVYYDETITNKGSETLKSIVFNSLKNYNENELTKFDDIIRYSRLCTLIDSSDNAIQNNITNLKIHKEMVPRFDISSNYRINLGNSIYYSGVPEHSIISNGFYTQFSNSVHYIKDNGLGTLQLFRVNNTEEIIVDDNIGYVDYSLGIIEITKLNIASLEGSKFELVIKPQSNDIISIQNQIIKLDYELLSISMLPSSNSHKLVSSRL